MESCNFARILVVGSFNGFITVSTLMCLCSLKNHGADEDVEQMFDMGAETMDLSMEEKMKYEQGDGGSSFG